MMSEDKTVVEVNLSGRMRQILKALLLTEDFKGYSEEAMFKHILRNFLTHEAVKVSVFRVFKNAGYSNNEIQLIFQDIGAPQTTAKCLALVGNLNHLSHRKLKIYGKAESNETAEVTDETSKNESFKEYVKRKREEEISRE
jgi:hypothetical protein